MGGFASATIAIEGDGLMARYDESKPFIPVRIAVLTVSDSRSLAEDRSGQVLVDRIEAAGHVVAAREILPDERDYLDWWNRIDRAGR